MAVAAPVTTPVHTTIQLGTSPDTGTSWTWELTRRPTGSSANLSATNIRNPTFTPDVADLFTFQLRVAKPDSAVRYSTVDVLATDCEPGEACHSRRKRRTVRK